MILSKRLNHVIGLLPGGEVIADVGCDHAYVSSYLVENKIYKKAIAMDVNKGPLSIAMDNIEKSGLSEFIECRLSNGFDKLQIDEADSAVIAGMGGRLLITIIQNDIEKARLMKALVLQPQSEIYLVRKFLRENGFSIMDEDMVIDDDKYYPMFLVRYNPNNEAIEMVNKEIDILNFELMQEIYDNYGKILIEKKNLILADFLKWEKEIYLKLLTNLPKDNSKRKEEVEHKLLIINSCMELMK